MKFSKNLITMLLVAVMALGCAADLSAQKRKTGKKRPATTTHTVKAQDLAGGTLLCFSDMDKFKMVSTIALRLNSADWDFGFTELEGSWSVTGNTLKVVSGGMVVTATSADGGKTFKGKLQNGKNGAGDNCVLYNVTDDANPSADAIKQNMAGGKYTAYMAVYKRDQPELSFPVTMKFTPDAGGNGGSYKITGDHVVLTALGLLKGKYAFGADAFEVSKLDGEMRSYKYDKCKNYIMLNLGQRSIPDLGNVNVLVYLIKK